LSYNAVYGLDGTACRSQNRCAAAELGASIAGDNCAGAKPTCEKSLIIHNRASGAVCRFLWIIRDVVEGSTG
jgi:hypothetical protein